MDGACDIGKGVSLEFALFTTVFVCAIGVAAFLALTLTVEADRRVSEPAPQHLPYFHTYCISGSQAVERFSQGRGGGGRASNKDSDSDDSFDHHSGLLSQAVREHMYSSINT